MRGEGVYVYDSDGHAYLDFASGISVNALGHANADITAAVSEQIAQLSHICNLYYSAPQADLAEMLCNLSFADKVYFANSGTEAVEAAIKFARKYARYTHGPGKTGIVSFTGGFHGRTAGSLALTPREKYQASFRPLMPDVKFAPFNDVEACTSMIGPETCAVFIEPVQGEGGINSVTPEFLDRAARCLRPLRRAAGLRRNPVRHGTHRQIVGLRAFRRPAGHDDAGEGARRRAAHRRRRS